MSVYKLCWTCFPLSVHPADLLCPEGYSRRQKQKSRGYNFEQNVQDLCGAPVQETGAKPHKRIRSASEGPRDKDDRPKGIPVYSPTTTREISGPDRCDIVPRSRLSRSMNRRSGSDSSSSPTSTYQAYGKLRSTKLKLKKRRKTKRDTSCSSDDSSSSYERVRSSRKKKSKRKWKVKKDIFLSDGEIASDRKDEAEENIKIKIEKSLNEDKVEQKFQQYSVDLSECLPQSLPKQPSRSSSMSFNSGKRGTSCSAVDSSGGYKRVRSSRENKIKKRQKVKEDYDWSEGEIVSDRKYWTDEAEEKIKIKMEISYNESEVEQKSKQHSVDMSERLSPSLPNQSSQSSSVSFNSATSKVELPSDVSIHVQNVGYW